MNRRKFITGCACCTPAILLPMFLKPEKQNFSYKETSLEMLQMDIVQHCNLGCKYCSHFSCIAEKEFYSLRNFKNDIMRISKLCNKQLDVLSLLGGEPLLHPNLEEILYISRKYFPYSMIVLVTNAILIDKMPESFWEAMSKNNIYFGATIYPIKGIDWEKIYNKVVKYNIAFPAHPDQYFYKSLDEVLNHKRTEFLKIVLDLEGKQDITTFCKFKINCTNLFNGKLYPCPTIANIRHFNKKFNKNIPVTEKDYVDIYKVKSSKEINEFLYSNIPFCKYCHGAKNMQNVKWETSVKHDISEWT